jgi:hypothetical protein
MRPARLAVLLSIAGAAALAHAQTAPVATAAVAPAAANAERPATAFPVHAGPRRELDGPQRRPLRRFLPVRLRRLDEEQSDSRRPGALVGLQQAGPGQPALPVGHPRRLVQTPGRPQRQPAEDRRLLRRLHGRARHREARRRAAQTLLRPDRGPAFQQGPAARAGAPAPGAGRPGPVLRLWLEPGLWRFHPRDRLRDRRRPGPAGPRLLPEDGREIAGYPREVRHAHRQHLQAARRQPRAGAAPGRARDGDGDRTGQGLAVARRQARPV